MKVHVSRMLICPTFKKYTPQWGRGLENGLLKCWVYKQEDLSSDSSTHFNKPGLAWVPGFPVLGDRGKRVLEVHSPAILANQGFRFRQ